LKKEKLQREKEEREAIEAERKAFEAAQAAYENEITSQQNAIANMTNPVERAKAQQALRNQKAQLEVAKVEKIFVEEEQAAMKALQTMVEGKWNERQKSDEKVWREISQGWEKHWELTQEADRIREDMWTLQGAMGRLTDESEIADAEAMQRKGFEAADKINEEANALAQ